MDTLQTRILIPVPPSPLLEQAVGYYSDRNPRYLALWWEPCGDEVMVSDGLVTFTGHWPGYLAYIQHVRVFPHLAGFNLGSSDNTAEHQLVIDRKERVAYVFPSAQASQLVAAQWEHNQPVEDRPRTFSMEELEAVIAEITANWQPPTSESVLVRMQADQKAVHSLLDWLDQPSEC